ncbi:hypothetical protein Tco_1150831 [Tanacetum coccineum]
MADSPPTRLYIDLPSEVEEDEVVAPVPPLPTPSPLSPLSSPLPRIPSPPLLLPLPTCRDIIPEADMSPQKRARFAAPSQRVANLVTSHRHDSKEFHVCHQDAQDDEAVLRASVSSLKRQRRYHRTTTIAAEQEATYARQAWTHVMDYIRELQAEIKVLQQQRRDDANRLTRHIQHDRSREDARDPEHHDGPSDASSSC